MSDVFLSKRVLKKKLAYVFSAWGVMPPIRKSINEAIEKSVAADVAPVVRCKDCEHWGTRKADGYGFCCIWGASVKEGQLDLMWSCLKLRKQTAYKSDVRALVRKGTY